MATQTDLRPFAGLRPSPAHGTYLVVNADFATSMTLFTVSPTPRREEVSGSAAGAPAGRAPYARSTTSSAVPRPGAETSRKPPPIEAALARMFFFVALSNT